jgi:hypothetical protein
MNTDKKNYLTTKYTKYTKPSHTILILYFKLKTHEIFCCFNKETRGGKGIRDYQCKSMANLNVLGWVFENTKNSVFSVVKKSEVVEVWALCFVNGGKWID